MALPDISLGMVMAWAELWQTALQDASAGECAQCTCSVCVSLRAMYESQQAALQQE